MFRAIEVVALPPPPEVKSETILGPNSIENFWLEFWFEKPLEFWLEIPCTENVQNRAM